MRLSEHFTLEEFTRSATATARGIDNTPNAAQLENLKRLAAALEDVRKLLGGKPIIISSGFRSAALNKAVGGSPTSDHANGLAADFTCPKYGSVESICRAIATSKVPFDQIIYEQGGTDWVHFGIGSRMRRQILSWAPGKGYVVGIHRLR